MAAGVIRALPGANGLEALLAEAPQHEVHVLPEEVFAHHATLAPTRTAAVGVTARAAQSVSVAEG